MISVVDAAIRRATSSVVAFGARVTPEPIRSALLSSDFF
jgi:hypothetical protein